jgi:TolB protein
MMRGYDIKKIHIIIFVVILILSLIVFPNYTLAQDPEAAYGAARATSLRRVIDAWGKGSFCASCHNMPRPLPPEESLSTLDEIPIGSVKMEPGLKRLTCDKGRDVEAFYSPDGNKIVWVTDRLGYWTIWSMNAEGEDKKQLTESNVISGWPSWNPNSQEIAYWSWNVTSGTCDIWKMDMNRNSKTKLTSDGTLKGPPAWSPRGDRIAYTASITGTSEVYLMNTEGGEKKQITSGHKPESYVENSVYWHVDGQRLYYTVVVFPLPEGAFTTIPGDVAYVEVFMLNVDTGEESCIVPKLHDNVRSVSSDGKRLVGISLRSFNYGLWIMNDDGTNQTRLTWDNNGDRAPYFNPKGDKIVYWAISYGNQPDVWVTNVDGSEKTRLTTSLYQDIYPSWSPDGKKIIFESDRAGNFDIWQKAIDEPIEVDMDCGTWATPESVNEASLTVKLTDPNTEIELHKIALRPYWETENDYIDYSESLPATLTTSNDAKAITINIDVPKDVELGYHFYDVRVEYSVNGDSNPRIYDCTGGDLEIDHNDRKRCAEMNKVINDELTELHNKKLNESAAQGEFSAEMVEPLKGYLDFLIRPEAEYFLKANDEYYKAEKLHRSGRYSEAFDRFENIEGILDSQEAETNKTENSWKASLSAVIPLVIVIVVISFIFIKRKNDERPDL